LSKPEASLISELLESSVYESGKDYILDPIAEALNNQVEKINAEITELTNNYNNQTVLGN